MACHFEIGMRPRGKNGIYKIVYFMTVIACSSELERETSFTCNVQHRKTHVDFLIGDMFTRSAWLEAIPRSSFISSFSCT